MSRPLTETRGFHQLNDSLLQEYQRFFESAFTASVQSHVVEQALGFFLQLQKADAERKGQVGRVRIFCDLIAKVDGA